MAEIDSALLFAKLQSFILDQLQVVSYKWLSRKFSVRSNSAKRLLSQFVEQHGDGLEVVYVISGWSKAEPGRYSVQLVPKAKLEEVKAEYRDGHSVHVYSVQSCLPKNPEGLWNAEFVQSEELFNQPAGADNCLWDNRFSGILCPLVKRNLNGKNSRIALPVNEPRLASATAAVNGLPKQNAPSPQIQVPSTSEKSVATVPKAAPQSSVSAVDIKESLPGKSINASTAGANKRKGQNGKVSEGTLANLWGRASSKQKPSSPPAPANHVSADAQINASEAAGNASSEDEDDFSQMRRLQSTNGSGRKRRFVFDMSDDENEDDVIGSKPAVNLASPELPKQTSVDKAECKSLQNKDENQENKGPGVQAIEKTKAASACKSTVSSKSKKGNVSGKIIDKMEENVNTSASEKNPRSGSIEQNILSAKAANNEINICKEERNCKDVCMAAGGVKKRKILKTHIDERGREVTEVTWEAEGVEPEKAKDAADPAKKFNVSGHNDNKPQASAKGSLTDRSHPAIPPAKPSSKQAQKGAGKDTRQGNILSFFKKS